MKKLIDISQAQAISGIFVSKIIENKISGCYIKSSAGEHYEDPSFKEHAKTFSDAGIRIGAYHGIFNIQNDPVTAAMHAQKVSAFSAGMMPLMLDIERNTALSSAEVPAWITYIKKFTAALSGKFIFYSYLSFFNAFKNAFDKDWCLAYYPELRYPTSKVDALRNSCLFYQAAFTAAWARKDVISAKKYAGARTKASLELSASGQEPVPLARTPASLLWQWGGDANAATCSGVRGFCDRITFNGNDEDWDNFYRFPPTATGVPAQVSLPTPIEVPLPAQVSLPTPAEVPLPAWYRRCPLVNALLPASYGR